MNKILAYLKAFVKGLFVIIECLLAQWYDPTCGNHDVGSSSLDMCKVKVCEFKKILI